MEGSYEMNKQERTLIEEDLKSSRDKMNRKYEVTGVDSIHCMEDLLSWKYSDRGWHIYKVNSCKYLGDIAMDKVFSITQLRLFYWIGENIIYNNVGYFDSKVAMKQCNVMDTQFRECMRLLEIEGMIKVSRNILGKRSDRLVSVSPAAFWKGDYQTRSAYIKDWYIGKGDKSWMEKGL